jgi:hypothetical protein
MTTPASERLPTAAYARLWSALVAEADLPLIEVARLSTLSVSLISRYLRGARRATDEARDQMAPVLAMGHRSEGDDAPPAYALARWSPGEGYAFLADGEERVGVIGSRVRAEQVAHLLAEVGLGDVVAVPAWPEWLFGYAEERAGGWVLLDAEYSAEAGQRIGRFVAEYAVALRAVPVPVGVPA